MRLHANRRLLTNSTRNSETTSHFGLKPYPCRTCLTRCCIVWQSCYKIEFQQNELQLGTMSHKVNSEDRNYLEAGRICTFRTTD